MRYRALDYNHFDQMTPINIGFITCDHLTCQVMISPDITKLLRPTILRSGHVTQQRVGLFKNDVTEEWNSTTNITRVAVEVGPFIPACKLYFSCISFAFLSALQCTILVPAVAVAALTHRGRVKVVKQLGIPKTQ